MKPAMYIFINKGLGMSTGKTAAQASHAAVEAFRLSMKHEYAVYEETNLVRLWYRGGHYMKLVMEARDSAHLRDTERYLNDRGFKTTLIIDEGHTEVAPITPTALGVELVDKDDPHTAATFESFRLYKDQPAPPDVVVIETTSRLEPFQLDHIKLLAKAGQVDSAKAYLRLIETARRSWLRKT